MPGRLYRFLSRQNSRLHFYLLLTHVCIAAFIFFAFWSLGLIVSHYSAYLKLFAGSEQDLLRIFQASGIGAASYWFYKNFGFKKSNLFLAGAREVERQSSYFSSHPRQTSELQVAASILHHQRFPREGSFEAAHIEALEKKLELFRTEILPRPQLAGLIALVVFSLVGISQMNRYFAYHLPANIQAWQLKSYEIQLPYGESKWQVQQSGVRGIKSSRIRFKAPDRGVFQTYLFVQEAFGRWQIKACKDFCEWTLNQSGQFAVGSLFARSAKFPILVTADEPPQAALFLVDGEDLIPGAELLVENKEALEMQSIAGDDVALKELSLIKRKDDKEEVLWARTDLSERAWRSTETVSLLEWSGGVYELFIRAKDHIQETESEPLVIMYADEEFKREQRIQSLRALIGQWVNILGDLLESKEDGKVLSSLSSRISSIEYPDNLNEELPAVYVEELKSLAEKIQIDLVIGQKVFLLPDYIAEVEKQLLYGLSLIFQQRVGDIRDSQEALSDQRKGLMELLDELKAGGKQLNSEELQKQFDELMKRLQDLTSKVSELPKGPQNEMLNREALEEQVSQAQSLEQQIQDIQRRLLEGDSETALKELESLLNQLSILEKEIDRSLQQYQENIDQGAFQSSENFQKELADLQKKQEELLKKTETLKDQQEALEKQPFDPAKFREQANDEKKLNEEFEKLAQEQEALENEFSESVQRFDEKLQGSEWESVFRSQQNQVDEEQVRSSMQDSEQGLQQNRASASITEQNEVVEALRQAQENQQQIRQQIQKAAEQAAAQGLQRGNEKLEIVESEGRGEKERRRKIMNSRRQKVEDRFQESHERYFEELLQR